MSQELKHMFTRPEIARTKGIKVVIYPNKLSIYNYPVGDLIDLDTFLKIYKPQIQQDINLLKVKISQLSQSLEMLNSKLLTFGKRNYNKNDFHKLLKLLTPQDKITFSQQELNQFQFQNKIKSKMSELEVQRLITNLQAQKENILSNLGKYCESNLEKIFNKITKLANLQKKTR